VIGSGKSATGFTVPRIIAGWTEKLERFKSKRRAYLLY
jgi:hypothetical protein